MTATLTEAGVDLGVCTNCGAELRGRYCAACGQKAAPVNPSLHDFLHDATHELLHLDGKIFQTLWLLFARPGFLTRELFAGRRTAYVSPLRLYLTLSVAAFALIAVIPQPPVFNGRDMAEMHNGFTFTGQGLNVQLPENVLSAEEGRRIQEEMTHLVPKLMFVMVPLCALLVLLVMRKTGRNYPQHLYFVLHVHAAFFTLLALMTPLDLLGSGMVNGMATLLRSLLVLAYGTIALRTAYGAGWGAAAAKAVAVFVVYMTLVGIAFVGVAIVLVVRAHA